MSISSDFLTSIKANSNNNERFKKLISALGKSAEEDYKNVVKSMNYVDTNDFIYFDSNYALMKLVENIIIDRSIEKKHLHLLEDMLQKHPDKVKCYFVLIIVIDLSAKRGNLGAIVRNINTKKISWSFVQSWSSTKNILNKIKNILVESKIEEDIFGEDVNSLNYFDESLLVTEEHNKFLSFMKTEFMKKEKHKINKIIYQRQLDIINSQVENIESLFEKHNVDEYERYEALGILIQEDLSRYVYSYSSLDSTIIGIKFRYSRSLKPEFLQYINDYIYEAIYYKNILLIRQIIKKVKIPRYTVFDRYFINDLVFFNSLKNLLDPFQYEKIFYYYMKFFESVSMYSNSLIYIDKRIYEFLDLCDPTVIYKNLKYLGDKEESSTYSKQISFLYLLDKKFIKVGSKQNLLSLTVDKVQHTSLYEIDSENIEESLNDTEEQNRQRSKSILKLLIKILNETLLQSADNVDYFIRKLSHHMNIGKEFLNTIIDKYASITERRTIALNIKKLFGSD